VSNGKITVLEHGGEMWVRVDAVHPLRDRITELESKLTAADEAWHEQEDELQSLRSRLQACFELVERPGLTSDGVVWELCKMRDASIQPNVVEKPAPIEDEASKFYAERAEEYFRIYGEAGKAALRKWFEGELPPEDRAFCLVHQLRFGEDDRCPKCALSE
jgi:hypothetical protein